MISIKPTGSCHVHGHPSRATIERRGPRLSIFCSHKRKANSKHKTPELRKHFNFFSYISMVSVNPSPAQGFYLFDPMNMNMGLPGPNSFAPNSAAPATASATTSVSGANSMLFSEDPSKKIRKPYTITKSRENWTEQEHDKFLEAIQLFDRDWKKIEAFIGSKTAIQIRSHAQKYFMKVQKSGTSEHVPPPRPKRKAAHPYPQKAPKNAPVVSQIAVPFQSSSAVLEPGFIVRPDSSSVLGNPITSAALPSWSYTSVPPVSAFKDETGLAGPTITHNCCYSSSNESKPRTMAIGKTSVRGNHSKPMRVTPDFAQVYSFIGSVFDPNESGHLERLKQMDPINFETVVVLMRNLSINLTSPEFEDHRRLLSSYDPDPEEAKSTSMYNNLGADKSEKGVSSA